MTVVILEFGRMAGDLWGWINPATVALVFSILIGLFERRMLQGGHENRVRDPSMPTFIQSFVTLSAVVLTVALLARVVRGEDAGSEILSEVALVVVDQETRWHYHPGGLDLGENWQRSAHPADLKKWFQGSAPFGFESATLPEAIRTSLQDPLTRNPRVNTYYFETEFTYSGKLADVGQLQLRHLIDDGAVFYLNGVELLRYNLPGKPGDPVSINVLASTIVGDAMFVGPVSVSAKALVKGNNRLSVEVHQRGTASSDVVMAVELTGKLIHVPQQQNGMDRSPVISNSIGMKLAAIADGQFMMGSQNLKIGANEDETPQHRVTLSKPFYMGAYEVTQAEYQRVMGSNPSYFAPEGRGRAEVVGLDTSRFPVDRVKGQEAVEFCAKLSELPEEKAAGRVYRLPTEAEWEYACIAGTDTAFHCGNGLSSFEGNLNGNLPSPGAPPGPFLNRSTTVGSYRPNAFGLFDMHGNVSEWCSDFYTADFYAQSPPEDPTGPEYGPGRVHRGGSWSSDAASCRSKYRDHVIDPYGYRTRGFRVVLALWKDLPVVQPTAVDRLNLTFQEKIKPLVNQYCLSCHAGADPEGGLSLETFQHASDVATTGRKQWQQVHDRLLAGTMPPPDQERPPDEEISFVREWIDTALATMELTGDPDPGHETIRRLNRSEYQNTIRDLLGIDFQTADRFPADDVGASGDVLSLAPVQMEKYVLAAEQIAGQVIALSDGQPQTAEAFAKVFIATVGGDLTRKQASRKIVTQLATRAYRRPALPEEIARLMKVVQNSYGQSGSFEKSIGAVIKAILVSPHFLFKVELDRHPDDPKVVRQLNDYELATRLSYFLWSSMPDDSLSEQAREGTLRKNLEAVTRRMLKDPKASALTSDFAASWLQLSKLKEITPDAQLFPEFDEQLRKAIRTETLMFFSAIVQEDRSLMDLVDTDFTFLNARLARHYGIPGIQGDEFRRVVLGDQPRGGLLTQASILTLTSNPDRTSPVKRGKWILENILGSPPPAPPPDVSELTTAGDAADSLSLRERLQQHRENRTCAACHEKMDALGFAFENYDAIGRWRSEVGQFPIDAKGRLPGGQEFDGAKQLNAVLRSQLKEEMIRCIIGKMLSYALGRELEFFDEPTLQQISQALVENDYRFSILIVKIVSSDPFLKRRGKRKRVL